jgi:NADH:ubiquinone reductase (non-electrogenic)
VQQKIVVLGTGFAALSALRSLRMRQADVTVVSPRNHFLFTPLLPSTTVGTIEFRSIIEPIRKACPAARYVHAACASIDPEAGTVTCRDAVDGYVFGLPYDVLVIAVGAVSNTFGVPGVQEYAMFLKELPDARAIRHRVIECFERASRPGSSPEERSRLLHFVVVGGGPTGVEFAAELHDFVTEDLRRAFRDILPLVQITLLEAGAAILNAFDATLAAYTLRHFQRQRIHVRTNSPVTAVRPDAIVLADGTEIPYGLVVWSTGVGPTEFVRDLPFEKDRAGRLITDAYLRLKGFPNIYAAGDCMTIEGRPFPATAQTAQQEGAYLARSLNHLMKGKTPRPFAYRHYGMLAYVGSGRALADLAAVKGKGFSTWVFWRSAYLTKLVSLKNKVLVLFDWVKTVIFGRDISKF